MMYYTLRNTNISVSSIEHDIIYEVTRSLKNQTMFPYFTAQQSNNINKSIVTFFKPDITSVFSTDILDVPGHIIVQ